jgi:hypothetical protein
MFYLMLRSTVEGYRFFDQERRANSASGHAITKRPLDIFEHYPDREAIILIRDPRAVLTSRHWSAPDEYFVGGRHCITGHQGLISMWRAIREKDGLLLRYEDIVSHPGDVQELVGVRFGLTFRGRFEDFYRAEIPDPLQRPLNGIRPLDGGHDWREHWPRIREQFDRYPELFDVLIEAGYETDRRWFLDQQHGPEAHHASGDEGAGA